MKHFLLLVLFLVAPALFGQEYAVNVSRTGVASETITIQQLAIPEARVRGKYMMVRCSVECTVVIRRVSSPATGATPITPLPGSDTANAAKFEVFRASNAGGGTVLNDVGDVVPAGTFLVWDMTAILLSQPRSGITMEITNASSGDIQFRSKWEQF